MAAPALPFRLVLAGATGLLLLGGVVAAATVDDDDDGDAPTFEAAPAARSEEATPTIAPAPDPAPETVPGPNGTAATATTAASGPPTTLAAAGRTTTTAKPRAGAVPGALVAPKVGAYGYDATTTSGGGAPSTSRVTVTVEAAGSEGATTLQDISIPTDQLGQRTTIRSRVAWGPAGAVVRRSQAMGADCLWQPAWPQYAGGLKVGRSWSYDTRCSVTTPVQATIERRGTRQVTGTQSIDAAGRSVATWTIAVDETTVFTTTLGVFSVRSVGTEQLAPSLGVPVAKDENLSGTGIPPGTTSTQKLATLP